VKKCLTCNIKKPITKEHWRFDKRRKEPYGSCKDCINHARRMRRQVDRVGKYDTDLGIKKRVRNKTMTGNLIEVERVKLILKDRIKNKEHLIVIGDKMICKYCNEQKSIILPISFKLLKKSMDAFKILHKHERELYS
jgi:hypothetical protein